MTDPVERRARRGRFAPQQQSLAPQPQHVQQHGPPPPGCPAHARSAIALEGVRFREHPAEVYRELRALHGPVAEVRLEGDVPAWLVMGYRELRHVLVNDQLFARDSRRWNQWDRIPPDWPLLPFIGHQKSIMFAEGEEHRRLSAVFSDVIGAVDQFELNARVEQIADRLIDVFAVTGQADLKTQFADRIPALVIAGLFGMSDEEAAGFTADLMESITGGPGALAAFDRTEDRLREIARDRAAAPGHDVVSWMAAHHADLTEDELVANLVVLIAASHVPTSTWISNTLRLLLTDSRFAVTLSGGRRSVPQALNEVLWDETPMQNFAGRWATRATLLGGQRIEAGDMIILGLAAANADPQVRPGFGDGGLGNQAQMSFSHGEHRCPYPAPQVAEIIVRAAVEVLLDRLPDAVLTVERDELRWQQSVWVRALVSLPVEFTPSHVTG